LELGVESWHSHYLLNSNLVKPLRLLLSAILLALAACESQPPQNHESRIHGDVGVRVQSHNTSRIDPTR